jgi:hypothetical protein
VKPSTVLMVIAYLTNQAVVLLEDLGHKLDRTGL